MHPIEITEVLWWIECYLPNEGFLQNCNSDSEFRRCSRTALNLEWAVLCPSIKGGAQTFPVVVPLLLFASGTGTPQNVVHSSARRAADSRTIALT